MCISAQLPRLPVIRNKSIYSQELRTYLDSFHQDFRTWFDALGGLFSRPESQKTLPSVQGLIDGLKQKIAGLMLIEPLHPSGNGSGPETLMDVHEYLMTAELMRLCGDIASSLRLVEYSGDYFL
jgi:hypothetical protein